MIRERNMIITPREYQLRNRWEGEETNRTAVIIVASIIKVQTSWSL
jgi:hypothetical protein